MKRILVLCTGNSCRSQMAEGYLKFYTQRGAEIHSAGLESHGVNPFAVKVMEEDSIDISGQHSKPVNVFRGQHFDYLVTVCDEAGQKILKGISYNEKIHFSIPDPATYQGEREHILEEFRRVREIVKKKMLKFIGKALLESSEAAA
ncbi:MAG: arsenate reductase ArsC [Lewinellaceae bacterium]|nr:arsenate reductase ArsC [Phaeodactylibacter sp.]MCB0613510.1 arsenate reductase ArsC [Phaeodactylibacter sp.]MCB9351829.1 arsenate reductase ArsC [Lewinellaceae bacterium]